MADEEKTDHDEERPLQPDVLELPMSGLVVQEGVLYRRTNKGTVIGRHPLDEITEVRIGRTLDRFALVMAAAFAGLSYVAYRYLDELEFWRWAAVLFFAAVALMFFSSLGKSLLILETAVGLARYQLCDAVDDCEGFVLTLQSMLRHKPGRKR